MRRRDRRRRRRPGLRRACAGHGPRLGRASPSPSATTASCALGAPESNEAMVRSRLLQRHAAAARFVPLNGARPTPAAAAVASAQIRRCCRSTPRLLGMGAGRPHRLALRRRARTLAPRSRPAAACGRRHRPGRCRPDAPSRVSLTGRALFDARLIVLLIGGEEKRAGHRAGRPPTRFAPPVAALLRQTRSPVRILWSPGGIRRVAAGVRDASRHRSRSPSASARAAARRAPTTWRAWTRPRQPGPAAPS